MTLIRLAAALTLLGLAAPPAALAAEASLTINVPTIEGRRVLRPYVAVWLESADSHAFVGNIAVWYDMRKRNNAGTKWLSDLRTWWRASNASTSLQLDGVSGATPAAGDHVIDLAAQPLLKTLPAGAYEVVVEAAREHGGREVLRVPLQWPPAAAAQKRLPGEAELGHVQLSVKP